MQEYACPACGARYTSLQALSLIDMSDGLFHCEVCRTVLADAEDGGAEGGGGGGDGGRRERLAEAKALQVGHSALATCCLLLCLPKTSCNALAQVRKALLQLVLESNQVSMRIPALPAQTRPHHHIFQARVKSIIKCTQSCLLCTCRPRQMRS